ncbi:unnamed protein product [Amoebophrya sp. A25]|nr:unnamed protein product [Amoebophrya sp. A25]|eukprot:GSA25T00012427001.1
MRSSSGFACSSALCSPEGIFQDPNLGDALNQYNRMESRVMQRHEESLRTQQATSMGKCCEVCSILTLLKKLIFMF